MKNYKVIISNGLVQYDIEAENEENAIDQACEWYCERKPEILHINRDKKSINDHDINQLLILLSEILEFAPDENNCTDSENEFLSEIKNMQDATDNYIRGKIIMEGLNKEDKR